MLRRRRAIYDQSLVDKARIQFKDNFDETFRYKLVGQTYLSGHRTPTSVTTSVILGTSATSPYSYRKPVKTKDLSLQKSQAYLDLQSNVVISRRELVSPDRSTLPFIHPRCINNILSL